jgi:hypothetical protein
MSDSLDRTIAAPSIPLAVPDSSIEPVAKARLIPSSASSISSLQLVQRSGKNEWKSVTQAKLGSEIGLRAIVHPTAQPPSLSVKWSLRGGSILNEPVTIPLATGVVPLRAPSSSGSFLLTLQIDDQDLVEFPLTIVP